ncbi:glycerate kinase [Ochrobactrum sp. S1502_03]|uniref:glycerate kinase n=1 Tax=Ochrobactrum sp. S1502_03 TaxID=3108451 RepID=UPI0037C95C56
MPLSEPRPFLASLFHAAVEAADPRHVILRYLPPKPKGRTIVVGAGKGAAQLARAFDDAWDAPLSGMVVTRYGYAVSCPRIEIREAGHPIPDEAGLEASKVFFELVTGLTEDDLVVALVSGGGSALLPAPPTGLTLEDEIALNKALLYSGAPISVMNTIRKATSRIKGGRLAEAAYPARVVTLVVSDVPGDDPADVSSGPTVASNVDPKQALEFIKAWRIDLPYDVMTYLSSQQAFIPPVSRNTRKRCQTTVIASAAKSLEAAAAVAVRAGIQTVILSDSIEGEARDVGQVHAAIARETALRDRPFAKPVLLLSGGETTVSFDKVPSGKGGRNCEFLLSFALGIQGVGSITALAADTDGIDGSEQNAGAYADTTSVERMVQHGINARANLHGHDSWTAFNALGDLFSPGPTGTNVNDFRAILVS